MCYFAVISIDGITEEKELGTYMMGIEGEAQ